MNHADDSLTKAFPAANWLFQPAAFGEAVDVLSKALGTEWAIERETDCYGEISIIALPNNDQAPRPGFILYEKNGRTHVATIVDDEWNRDEGFDSFRSGVSALIAQARATLLETKSTYIDLETLGGAQDKIVIAEPGFYTLVMRSDEPKTLREMTDDLHDRDCQYNWSAYENSWDQPS